VSREVGLPLNSAFEIIMIKKLISLKKRYIASMTAGIPDDLSDIRKEIAEFITYPDVMKWEINWSQDNGYFLQEVGLPVSAPTMIEFQSPVDVDSENIHIGFNNYGDRIAIAKASGNVVYINHDFNDRIEYMNRDAISLFRTICAFADMMKGQSRFMDRIAAFDQQAIQEGQWWKREYISWINKKSES